MRILLLLIIFSLSTLGWSQFSEYSPLALAYSQQQPKVYQQVKKFCLKKWTSSSYTPRRIDDAQAVMTIYDIHAQLGALNELMNDPTLNVSYLIEVLSQTVVPEDKDKFNHLMAANNQNELLESCMFDWVKTKKNYQQKGK